MSGWGRVDDVAEPWKARWEEAEHRFFSYDEYGLEGSRDSLTIWPLTPGESEPREAGGRVVVSEREIRIGDAKFQAVVDVRRDRSRWPRDVFRHETDRIGTIKRRRGRGGRPAWAVANAQGAVVATIRESSLARAAGRHSLEVAGSAARSLATGGLINYAEARSRSDFVISGPDRQLGEIRGGCLLDLTADLGRELDRRLAVAAFVSIVLAEQEP